MRAGYNGLAVRDLDCLFRRGILPAGDRALLDRFLAGDADSAFEALIARHGPMVLGVCRRLLPSPHDADDAFQATFLVLARKAARIRDPDRLGPWLYGVAMRVATKARARAGRHRHEPLDERRERGRPDAGWSDVMPILDAELGRLSAKHRDVLVLCLLEGASPEEAAHRLRCPVGTVKSRLARGRQILRTRLVARGIAPATALAVLSAAEALASPVPLTLIRATLDVTAASAVAPGLAALTRGVTAKMFAKSTVMASVLVGGIALAGIGVAAWMGQSRAQEPGDAAQPQAGPQDRQQAQADNLKRILLAFHNFEATNGRLPAAATYGADGLPKLSWRVALLPYLDQGELYNEFRQAEPWDSPHNKALIGRMPAVFETPEAPAPRGQTRIRGFAGEGAIFEGAQGVGPVDITDGTSNTLLVAVASEPTPWTKPGELPFVAGQYLPPLDDGDPDGYQIGMVDGSVRSLPTDKTRMLPALITRAGGEVIEWAPMQVAGEGAGKGALPGEAAGARGARKSRRPRVTVPAQPGGMMAGMMGGMVAQPGMMAGGMPGRGMMKPGGMMGGPGMTAGMMPGMAMGMAGPAPPTEPGIEQRLQRMEETLERIMKKLDAAFPEGDGAEGARRN